MPRQETAHLLESICATSNARHHAEHFRNGGGAAAADHVVGDDEDRRRRTAHRAVLPRHARDRHVQRLRTGRARHVDLGKLADVLVGHVQERVQTAGLGGGGGGSSRRGRLRTPGNVLCPGRRRGGGRQKRRNARTQDILERLAAC